MQPWGLTRQSPIMDQDGSLDEGGYCPQSADVNTVTLTSDRNLSEEHSLPTSDPNISAAPGAWKALILDETDEQDKLSPNHDTAIALGLSRSRRFAPNTDWKNVNSKEDEELSRNFSEEQDWRIFKWLMSDMSWTRLDFSRRLDIDVTRYEQYMRSIPFGDLEELRSTNYTLDTTNSVSRYYTATSGVFTNDIFFSVTSYTQGSKTIATEATTE